MQLGMIGLGRMGSGMTDRLREHGVEVHTYDPNVEARTADSLQQLKEQLEAPRAFWMMIPAGEITESTFHELLEIADEGDTIVDGGNSNFRDSKRRYVEAKHRGIHFVDAGVSGGVWGLEVGFCLMVGGDDEPVKRLEPVFTALAPEAGYAHVGASGAGHFVKMVHNGIEYGLMQSYAEGFEIMEHSEYDLDAHEISGIWRNGSVVRSWLLELLHSAFESHGSKLEDIAPLRRGLRRRPLDDQRGDQRERAGAGDRSVALRAFRLRVTRSSSPPGSPPLCATSSAGTPSRRSSAPRPARTQVAMAVAQENPLLEGLEARRAPDDCILVIFGASGDLTKRKLFPALYSLAYRRLLPEHFAVVGVARTEESDDEFRDRMKEAVQEHSRDEFRDDAWELLASGMRYVAMDFADEAGEDRLAKTLTELDKERETKGNRVYYLATPPSVFETVVHAVGKRRTAAGLGASDHREAVRPRPCLRPRAADSVIEEYFDERQVFRIDHYLGKETVQNMLALRFANGIFEPIWNRQYVDHVQITVAETMGVEGRGGYYEQAGALRDMVQNHMLQLIALIAMEPPVASLPTRCATRR